MKSLFLAESTLIAIFIISFFVVFRIGKKYITKRAESEGLSNDDFVRKEFDATSVRIIEYVSKDWDKED